MSAVHTRMRGPYRAIQKHNDTVLSVMVTILDDHTVEVHVQTQKNTDGGLMERNMHQVQLNIAETGRLAIINDCTDVQSNGQAVIL